MGPLNAMEGSSLSSLYAQRLSEHTRAIWHQVAALPDHEEFKKLADATHGSEEVVRQASPHCGIGTKVCVGLVIAVAIAACLVVSKRPELQAWVIGLMCACVVLAVACLAVNECRTSRAVHADALFLAEDKHLVRGIAMLAALADVLTTAHQQGEESSYTTKEFISFFEARADEMQEALAVCVSRSDDRLPGLIADRMSVVQSIIRQMPRLLCETHSEAKIDRLLGPLSVDALITVRGLQPFFGKELLTDKLATLTCELTHILRHRPTTSIV